MVFFYLFLEAGEKWIAERQSMIRFGNNFTGKRLLQANTFRNFQNQRKGTIRGLQMLFLPISMVRY